MIRQTLLTLKDYLPTVSSESIPPVWKNPVAWGVVGIGFVTSLWMVLTYGVNMFWDDEWTSSYHMFSALNGDGSFWASLWTQHNSHRHVLPRIAYYVLSLLPTWDVRYLLVFNHLLVWLTVFPLLAELPRHTIRTYSVGLLLFIMLISPVHYVNQLMSIQISFILVWFGMVYSVFFLTRKKLNGNAIALAVGATMLAYLSSSGGLVVWINGWCLLVIRTLHHPPHRKWVIVWTLLTAVALGGYFYEWQEFHHTPIEGNVMSLILHTFAQLAHVVSTDFIPVATWVGMLGFCFFCYLVFRKQLQQHLFAYGLIQYALGASLSISFQNAQVMQGIKSLNSHYAILTLSFWFGLLALSYRARRTGIVVMVCIGLLLLHTGNKSAWRFNRYHSNLARGKVCYHAALANPNQINPEILPYRDCKFLGIVEQLQKNIDRIFVFQKLGVVFPE